MFKKLDDPTKFLIWLLSYIFGFSLVLGFSVAYLELDDNVAGIIAILITLVVVISLLKHYVKIPN